MIGHLSLVVCRTFFDFKNEEINQIYYFKKSIIDGVSDLPLHESAGELQNHGQEK